MNEHDEEQMEQLLQQALSPIGDARPASDLWPSMLRRLDARPPAVPWFDWALAGGLAVLAVLFPAAIPVFLYYL